MNFLQMIYAKTAVKTDNNLEIVPYERLRTASTQFSMHTLNYSGSGKADTFLKEVQHFLNEMLISLESEIRFSQDKKCYQYLFSSKILDDIVSLAKNDTPKGVLQLTLNFFQQIFELANDYPKEKDDFTILNEDNFVRPLLKLLDTAKLSMPDTMPVI